MDDDAAPSSEPPKHRAPPHQPPARDQQNTDFSTRHNLLRQAGLSTSRSAAVTTPRRVSPRSARPNTDRFAAGPRNVAHLLELRRGGRVPASAGGRVSGGLAYSRLASAEARAGGGSFGFRRNVGGHPSLIGRLRHTATLRGHTREFGSWAGRAIAGGRGWEYSYV